MTDFTFPIDNITVRDINNLTEDDWNVISTIHGVNRNIINIFKIMYRVIQENKDKLIKENLGG